MTSQAHLAEVKNIESKLKNRCHSTKKGERRAGQGGSAVLYSVAGCSHGVAVGGNGGGWGRRHNSMADSSTLPFATSENGVGGVGQLLQLRSVALRSHYLQSLPEALLLGHRENTAG